MVSDIEVAAEEPGAPLTVPAHAVFSDEAGNSRVWVVDPDDLTVHERPVTIGPVTGTNAIIVFNGLDAGEMIAAAGIFQLQDSPQTKKLTLQSGHGLVVSQTRQVGHGPGRRPTADDRRNTPPPPHLGPHVRHLIHDIAGRSRGVGVLSDDFERKPEFSGPILGRLQTAIRKIRNQHFRMTMN